MSRMSELDAEMKRLALLDKAVRNYLSQLVLHEQGRVGGEGLGYWRERLVLLTVNEPLEVD